MPSYLRLLTEKASEITTPPTGHTAVWASSGESTYDQYDLYIKNPEGFIYKLGGTGTSEYYAVNTFYSGITVYSGGFTSSGAVNTSIALNGVISGITDNLVYIQPGLNIQGTNGWTGGNLSGTTTLAYGSANTVSGMFSQSFGTGNTSSATGATTFGTGNTASGFVSLAMGGSNVSSGQLSLTVGTANTASGIGSISFGGGNNTAANYSLIATGIENTTVAAALYSIVGGQNNTQRGKAGVVFGTGNTLGTASSAGTVFGTGNTANANSSTVFGGSNSATGEISFIAGSGSTASGTTYITLGRRNVYSGLFSVGDGNGLNASNRITAQLTGVTIGMTGAGKNDVFEYQDTATNAAASLLVLSGTGDHPLGFKLPTVQHPYEHKSGVGTVAAWPALSASTKIDNKGMMIWDGTNIRVWTGGTLWATLATQGGGGSL